MVNGISYRHTQRGRTVAILSTAGAAALLVALALAPQRPERGVWIAIALAVLVMLLSAWAFSTLTVEVSEGELSWRFGAGVFRKRLPLREIAGATPVRTPLWHGVGIHWVGSGWLYNVAPGDAVEITTNEGKRIRIGTDEPMALASAIERARHGTP